MYISNCINLFYVLSALSIMTLQVNVKDNNIEQALRSLKKKMQREGLYKEMKLRKHFEKPCLKRAREKEENIRRARKSARRNNA
jgi:small subunit ribosomal protein S21